ncbi:MAG: phosphotransferase, partial [Pseudomonadota bacterium]
MSAGAVAQTSQPEDARIARFLDRAGWTDAAIAPLAGDASNRRYLRVQATGRSLVLMDAPPARNERMDAFVSVTRWLR